ncbi:MAG: hypothetical protein Q8N35_07195 [Methylococcaceae bacterium]|nr:hypothetical protein [Methylococcaceae bacterium]MDZ4157537.1 hypothetical protein [Methylococcales bacterium]MDP2394899.1 hypothetical protein [Methylococcaceae bacterium]MDP3019354.1 hypothetical protein [Methylococcaceae bacterium]MDP3389051.1 hypothetical protein [Methylococcaceae bacterium]
MNLKKRGLGRGLEALLADGADKDEHGLVVGSESESERHTESQGASNTGVGIKADTTASDLVANELKKFQSVAENSRKRVRQIEELPNMQAASLDIGALSSVVRVLIEDVKRDNLVLLEEAERLLQLFDEFESIIRE